MLSFVVERIIELCDILLPVLEKLEGSSRAVAFLVIAKIGAQVAMYRDGKEEVLHYSITKIVI